MLCLNQTWFIPHHGQYWVSLLKYIRWRRLRVYSGRRNTPTFPKHEKRGNEHVSLSTQCRIRQFITMRNISKLAVNISLSPTFSTMLGQPDKFSTHNRFNKTRPLQLAVGSISPSGHSFGTYQYHCIFLKIMTTTTKSFKFYYLRHNLMRE